MRRQCPVFGVQDSARTGGDDPMLQGHEVPVELAVYMHGVHSRGASTVRLGWPPPTCNRMSCELQQPDPVMGTPASYQTLLGLQETHTHCNRLVRCRHLGEAHGATPRAEASCKG